MPHVDDINDPVLIGLAREHEAYNEGFNHALAAAATWLKAKADKMRRPDSEFGAPTANMMARVYEAEADGILSLRK